MDEGPKMVPSVLARVDRDQTARINDALRGTEEQGVNDAEDGGVGARPEAEADEENRGQRPGAPHAAHCGSHVFAHLSTVRAKRVPVGFSCTIPANFRLKAEATGYRRCSFRLPRLPTL